jgi:hypothetical protein
MELLWDSLMISSAELYVQLTAFVALTDVYLVRLLRILPVEIEITRT